GNVTMTLREDRHRTQPWGLYGGRAAPLSVAEIGRAGNAYEGIPSKGVYALAAGDRVRCRVSGGAGYGDPLRRDPALVREDVLDRKITRRSAEEDYGVIFGAQLAVDEEGTRAKRMKLAAARGTIDWTYDRGGLGTE